MMKSLLQMIGTKTHLRSTQIYGNLFVKLQVDNFDYRRLIFFHLFTSFLNPAGPKSRANNH